MENFFPILHLLPLIYSIFTCVDPDPYSDYGSGSTTLFCTTPMQEMCQKTGAQYMPVMLYTLQAKTSINYSSSVENALYTIVDDALLSFYLKTFPL